MTTHEKWALTGFVLSIVKWPCWPSHKREIETDQVMRLQRTRSAAVLSVRTLFDQVEDLFDQSVISKVRRSLELARGHGQ